MKLHTRRIYDRLSCAAAHAIPATLLCISGGAYAYKPDTGPDWDVNIDTSLQYTLGVRAQKRNDNIGNQPFFAEGDYKFDRGDIVTDRIQTIVELQGVYKSDQGFRLSGSAWKDFAYSDKVFTNPNPAFSSVLTYPDGRYSADTKKYTIQGGELLDAFAFKNGRIGDVPVYLKLGRFTQQWGNALFFGFSSISFSQHPTDFIKAFSQPGSEIKELFLPRAQAMASTELSPQLSLSAQYFLEFRENRYPEGGTYLGPFDIAYAGPTSGGALAGSFGGPVSAGRVDRPKGNDGNFGLKADWSPSWADGNIGFYYRQLDEVHPWLLLDTYADGGGALHLSYARRTQLFGLSYERTFGTISTGLEANFRKNTALSSSLTNGSPGTPYDEGARGNIVNLIGNALVQLGTTPLWDAGTLILEASYTQLTSVTKNANLFNGLGYAGCPTDNKWDGCATKHALALAGLFEPQWVQALPGIDLSVPVSYTYGVTGNPAYAAGSFYAQGTNIYSVGLKGSFQGGKTTAALTFNGYHWHHSPVSNIPGFGDSYSGLGGNGAVALNDKGFIALTLKTSF
jgi:hypothetical protein